MRSRGRRNKLATLRFLFHPRENFEYCTKCKRCTSKPSPGRGISETRKSQAVGADLFRWSTLMQWLGDRLRWKGLFGTQRFFLMPVKLKEAETPKTSSSVTCGASFPYEGKPYFRVRCSAEKGYPAQIGVYYLQNLQGGI